MSTPQGQAEMVQSVGFSGDDSIPYPPEEEPDDEPEVYKTLKHSVTTSSSPPEPEEEYPPRGHRYLELIVFILTTS